VMTFNCLMRLSAQPERGSRINYFDTVIGQGWGDLTRAAVPLSLDLMEGKGLIRRVGRSPSRAIVLETKSEVCDE
jgi:hypothetical protein